MMPEPSPGEIEHILWAYAPKEKRGQITSLEELKEWYPVEDENNDTGVDLLENRKEYSIFGKMEQHGKIWFIMPFAYQCNNCEELIIGPPYIPEESILFQLHPINAPWERYRYSLNCHNCQEHFSWN